MPYYGHSDPREGEHPSEAEWCFEHGQMRESCGPCEQGDIERELFEARLVAEQPTDSARTVIRAMLDILRASDETMGAALAARFEGDK